MSDDEGEAFFDGGEEVEYVGEEGPGQKLMGGCISGCIGCVLFPAMLFMLGWNEKRHVCDMWKHSILEGNTEELACNADLASVEDKSAFFSCPVDTSSYSTFQPFNFDPPETGGDFAQSLSFKGPVAFQRAQMYQCIESEHERTEGSGNNKRRIKTWTYDMQWRDEVVDTSYYRTGGSLQDQERGCGGWNVQNGKPSVWPSNVGEGSKKAMGDPLKSGSFTLDDFLMDKYIESNDAPDITETAVFRTLGETYVLNSGDPVEPKDLKSMPGGIYNTCDTMKVGCFKILYGTNDDSHATVFAKIGSGGITDGMPIPGKWGCEATDYERLWMKNSLMTKEETIESLNTEAQTMTWLLRVLGVFGAWIAVFCIFGPVTALIDVLGDFLSCIPCVGDCLEDYFEGIANFVICILSAGIGCGCAFIVISIVYVFMRPMIGIPMLILACCCCACGAGARYMCGSSGKKRRDRDEEEGDDEE